MSKQSTLSCIRGTLSVVFNDRIGEKEADLVYGFMKRNFRDFHQDDIVCGRHSVRVELNHLTALPDLTLDGFFDMIRGLSPESVNAVQSMDGLTIDDADEDIPAFKVKGEFNILTKDAAITPDMMVAVRQLMSERLQGFRDECVTEGVGVISVELMHNVHTTKTTPLEVINELYDLTKALSDAFLFIDTRDVKVFN